MKRIFWCVMACILAVSMLPFYSNAADCGGETVIATFEDGSYMTERILFAQTRAGGTVSGSKERNYYDSNGRLYWKAVLNGTFSYTGTSATCTSASCDASSFCSEWYLISKSASRSGNTAYASVTMGERAGGITVSQEDVQLTLECDGNGNLS